MCQPLKLTFLADTHYYAPSLGTAGKAYEHRSGADQKCLAETGAIIDAAFAKMRASDTDAVMIAGDLTNDGERVSHIEFIQKLKTLKQHKPVYVTVATHDWCCDRNARRYSGDCVCRDVDTVHHTELREMYRAYGLCSASDEFITHLGLSSYRAELSNNVVLLALNDDQNGKGKAGFTADHLAWIVNHIRTDTAAGKTVIAMEHHLLYPHISRLVTGGACCGDNAELLQTFADAGLRFLFAGHSHIQRIDRYVSPAGNVLHAVNIGSLCGYPAPMVNVTVCEEAVTIQTEHLQTFSFGGKLCTQEYLKNHALNVVFGILKSARHDEKSEYIKKAAELGLCTKTALQAHPILKIVSKKLDTATVGSVGKTLNRLTGGTTLNRQLIQKNADIKISRIVSDFMLAALDGTPELHFCEENLRELLSATAAVPVQTLRKLGIRCTGETLTQLRQTVDEILWGGETDNNKITVKRF